MGDVFIGGGQPGTDIHHHHNAVRCVNGDLGLFTHMRKQPFCCLWLNAAGIYQQKLVAAPFALCKDTIPRNAGRVLHYGKALAAQFIKQCRFAHIWAAYHCYYRFAHLPPPSSRG